MTKSEEQPIIKMPGCWSDERIIAFNLDMYKMFYEEILGKGCPELKPEHWTVASALTATHTLFLLSNKLNQGPAL